MRKVSVIIPAYNAEDTIKDAIESVPNRDDIEIVVINDGSTDTTLEVVKKTLDSSGRNYTIFSKKNGGVASAVNKGLDLATGEYAVLLGADDDFYAEEFEKAMVQLDGTDLVYFDLRINDGTIFHLAEETKWNCCGSVKFMRREFIGDTRNDETKKSGEDFFFFKELQAKKPTEKFTNLVVKHYNYPRVGSLSWRQRNGKIGLSIIIPYYDPQRIIDDKLKRLLLALKSQQKDYPETEIVLVADGCSPDWLLEVERPLMRIVRCADNGGLSRARNVGLDNISGEYVSFIDADDGIEPDYLHTIYGVMRQGYDYALFPFIYETSGNICQNREGLYGNYAVWAWCYNRRILEGKRFNEKLNVGEDIDWTPRVIKPEMNGYRSDKAIYRYDWDANPDSLSKRFNRGDIPHKKSDIQK